MTYRTTIVASTALLALTACSRSSENAQANLTVQTSETAGANAAPQSTERVSPGFISAVAAGDAFEIETSKLAISNSTAAAVKSYAQNMIEAHTASTAKLKSIAAGLVPAMTPSPALSPEQTEKVDQLKTLRGAAFDQAYIAGQAAGHQQTLDMLKIYAATGATPQLKIFADDLIPIVTAHLNMVESLKA